MNPTAPDQACIVDEFGLEDFDPVLALLQQLWPGKTMNRSVLREMFQHAHKSSHQVLLCARIADQVVGFGSLTVKSSLYHEGNLGYINELVVDNGSKRQGLGKALVERLVTIAKERGCRCVELDCASHRKDALAFYDAAGYRSRAFLLSKAL